MRLKMILKKVTASAALSVCIMFGLTACGDIVASGVNREGDVNEIEDGAYILVPDQSIDNETKDEGENENADGNEEEGENENADGNKEEGENENVDETKDESENENADENENKEEGENENAVIPREESSQKEEQENQIVSYECKKVAMSIELPPEWDYKIRTVKEMEKEDGLTLCGIDFWLKEKPKVKLKLDYWTSPIGMCGTGVTVEEVTFENGLSAWKYTETHDMVWFTLIYELEQEYGDLVADASIEPKLWEKYEQEIMEILGTVSFENLEKE